MLKRGLPWVLVLSACSSNSTPGTNNGPQPPDTSQATVTYHEHIRPIVEDKCLSCHAEGGVGPFTLDSYASLDALGLAVVDAVESKSMPPWPLRDGCQEYLGDRSLDPEDIGVFREWYDQGKAEGDPAKFVSRIPQGLEAQLPEPTMTLRPSGAYSPSPERPDDYRCFVFPHEFEEETYMLRAKVRPQRTELVHHVIVYMVGPEYAEAVQQLEANEPGAGYTCFGGVGVGSPDLVTGWTPGAPIQEINPDVAVRIPKGAKLVMQMHYNVLSSAPQPDLTEVDFWFGERQPAFLIQTRPLPYLGLVIDPGDANSLQERVFTNTSNRPWTIVAAAPHMHLLGKTLKATAIHDDGSEECIVDVERWDFNWQGSYTFADQKQIIVQPGEKIRLECGYDNSLANQPVINGDRRNPVRVTWGEGTLDEMCLNYIVTIEPYSPLPEPGQICSNYQTCYDRCRQNGLRGLPTVCALECSAADSGECANCVVPGMIQCGIDICPTQASGLIQCLESCAGQSNNCVARSCVGSIVSYDSCMAQRVQSGGCDLAVAACGAHF